MSANQKTLVSLRTATGWLGKILATAVTYDAGACVGQLLTVPGTNVGLIWPPVGMMLAIVILFGRRVWPGIFIGACALNVPILVHEYPAATTAAIAAGQGIADVLQVLLGAYLFERIAGTRNPLNRARDVLTFVVVAAILSQAIGATVGVASLYFGGKLLWTEFGRLWWDWWVSNMASVLLIAPFLLSWLGNYRRPATHRFAMGGLVCGLAALGSFLLFHLPTPTSQYYFDYIAMLFVVWAAFTLGQTGTTAVTLLVAFVAIWSTATGSGPFLRTSPDESLLVLEVFLATLAILGLILAGVLTERKQAEEALRKVKRSTANSSRAPTTPLSSSRTVCSATAMRRRLGSPATHAMNSWDIFRPTSPPHDNPMAATPGKWPTRRFGQPWREIRNSSSGRPYEQTVRRCSRRFR